MDPLVCVNVFVYENYTECVYTCVGSFCNLVIAMTAAYLAYSLREKVFIMIMPVILNVIL